MRELAAAAAALARNWQPNEICEKDCHGIALIITKSERKKAPKNAGGKKSAEKNSVTEQAERVKEEVSKRFRTQSSSEQNEE